jgi:hypothetical protein
MLCNAMLTACVHTLCNSTYMHSFPCWLGPTDALCILQIARTATPCNIVSCSTAVQCGYILFCACRLRCG